MFIASSSISTSRSKLCDRPWLYDCGNTNRNAVVGNIADYYRVCTDNNVVSNGNGSQNLCAGPEVDVVADYRSAGFIDSPQPHDYAVADSAIVAKFGVAAHDNSAEMVNDKISTDVDFTWNFDSRNDLNELEPDPIYEREQLSEDQRPHRVAPTAKSVNHECPEALGAPVATVSPQILSDIFKHTPLSRDALTMEELG